MHMHIPTESAGLRERKNKRKEWRKGGRKKKKKRGMEGKENRKWTKINL